jgi:predicted transcriptional regulator of viral defense system
MIVGMTHSLPIDHHGLIRFADVRELGCQSELYAMVTRGEVERIRRGVYREVVATAGPQTAATEADHERQRRAYVSDVYAAARAFTSPVFTSCSAAALMGLPIIGPWPGEVFVMARDAHGSRRRGVVTVARTREIEVVMVNGCAVTSVEFTLLQLARHASLVAALTATDAALHVPRFGGAPPMTTLERLRAEHERLKPYPRSRRGRCGAAACDDARRHAA